MRIDALTVVLRPRSSWEAVELGTALVRRHARAVWRPWLACTLPAFAVANALAWLVGTPALALLAMWWLKPVFDRVVLHVLAHAVFGDVPDTRATLRGAFRGGGRAMLGYLTWRRLSPARALLLPVDVLEGGSAKAARDRRRVLAGPAYGVASLCLMLFSAFESAVTLGLAMLAFLFVPNEYVQDVMGAVWQHIRDAPPWLQLLENTLAWAATSLVEPFYVGSGFGQYLNRRTEIEAWDIELAFRRLRERLSAMTTAAALMLALMLVPWSAHAAAPAFVPASTSRPASAPVRPTPGRTATTCPIPARDPQALQRIFGREHQDPAAFARAVDQAYADPRLRPRRKVSMWVARHPSAPRKASGAPAWLEGFARVVAAIGEIGLWLLAGALVLVLALTARHWWPWLHGVASDPRAPEAPVVDSVAADAAPLPDDIVGAARRLWQSGQPREALALAYRAAVEAMLAATGRVLPPGATEAQCLRTAQALPETSRRVFARVVRQWQYAAWAERLPTQDEFDSALDDAAHAFGWRT